MCKKLELVVANLLNYCDMGKLKVAASYLFCGLLNEKWAFCGNKSPKNFIFVEI